MRTLAVIALTTLAAAGCGKMSVGVEGNGGVGTFRSFVAGPASSTQLNQIQALCTKLQQKDSNFVNYVNGYTRFVYDTTVRACDGTQTSSTVNPTLTSNGSVLQFSLPAGQSLATGVETATAGQISQLCRALSNLGYPHEVSSNVAIWYSIPTGGDCSISNQTGVECIQLETGTKPVNGSNYTITSVDKFFLRFNGGQDSGMVIRHERYEQGGCSAGKSVLRTSVFVGLN